MVRCPEGHHQEPTMSIAITIGLATAVVLAIFYATKKP